MEMVAGCRRVYRNINNVVSRCDEYIPVSSRGGFITSGQQRLTIKNKKVCWMERKSYFESGQMVEAWFLSGWSMTSEVPEIAFLLSRLGINPVRLPIILLEVRYLILLSPFARENSVWQDKSGRPVPRQPKSGVNSRVPLLLAATASIPSVKSRVCQIMHLLADGLHRRESAGAGL